MAQQQFLALFFQQIQVVEEQTGGISHQVIVVKEEEVALLEEMMEIAVIWEALGVEALVVAVMLERPEQEGREETLQIALVKKEKMVRLELEEEEEEEHLMATPIMESQELEAKEEMV